jgi:precorrin-2 methylase
MATASAAVHGVAPRARGRWRRDARVRVRGGHRASIARASAATPSSASESTGEIVVVGLGPGNPAQITLEAWAALTADGALVHVRTAKHPTLSGLPAHVALRTFDHVYERTKRLEDVYPAMVEDLNARAVEPAAEVDAAAADAADAADASSPPSSSPPSRAIVYAVPGDPCVAENSVNILLAAAPARGVSVTLVPGLSFLEPTLAAAKADLLPSLAVVDAIDVAVSGYAIGISGDAPVLLCQLYSNALASDVKLTLMNQYPEETPVTLVHAAGCDDEIVETLPLCDVDRSEHIDILTSAYIPAIGGGGAGMESLLDVIVKKRTGGGGGGVGVDGGWRADPAAADGGFEDDRRDDPGPGPGPNPERDVSSSSGGSFDFDDAFDSFDFDECIDLECVWSVPDHAEDVAVDALRSAAMHAVAAAAADAPAEVRAEALGKLLAQVGLHVALAVEVGEFAMRDVVRAAIESVRREGGTGGGDGDGEARGS